MQCVCHHYKNNITKTHIIIAQVKKIKNDLKFVFGNRYGLLKSFLKSIEDNKRWLCYDKNNLDDYNKYFIIQYDYEQIDDNNLKILVRNSNGPSKNLRIYTRTCNHEHLYGYINADTITFKIYSLNVSKEEFNTIKKDASKIKQITHFIQNDTNKLFYLSDYL